MVEAVLGWLGAAIETALSVIAFPAQRIPPRGFAETVVSSFCVILMFWLLAGLIVGWACRAVAFALEYRWLPGLTAGMHPQATKRFVASVFWLAGVFRRLAAFLHLGTYGSGRSPLSDRRYARPRPGSGLATALLSVPYVVAKMVGGVLRLARSWVVLVCLAAGLWVAVPTDWTLWRTLTAALQNAVAWLVSSPAILLAWVSILALLLAFVAAPARRGRLAWRSSRYQRAHELHYKIAVRASAAAYHLRNAVDDFGLRIPVALDEVAEVLTDGWCYWDGWDGLQRNAKRRTPWHPFASRTVDTGGIREREFEVCRRELKRLARLVRQVEYDDVVQELWKITPPNTHYLLLRLRPSRIKSARGARSREEIRRFPLQVDLGVIDPQLPERLIEPLREQRRLDLTDGTAPTATQLMAIEREIIDLRAELHREFVEALWCLEEFDALARSVDRHTRPRALGRAADVVAGR